MRISKFVPVERASSFHEIVFRLEQLIRLGTLQPGEKLPSEPELAKAFQVSRPTLREAIKALGLLGILVSRTGDGTYVREDNRDLFKTAIHFTKRAAAGEFLGLIEARIAIEPFLAELAAGRATASDRARMKSCLEEMEGGVGDLDKYLRGEVAFHDEITKAARSPVLRAIMDSLRDLLLEGRRKITADQTGRKNLGFHRRIFEAIQQRDPELARQNMLAHLRDNRARYEAFYRNLKLSSISRRSLLASTADWDLGSNGPEDRLKRRHRKSLRVAKGVNGRSLRNPGGRTHTDQEN